MYVQKIQHRKKCSEKKLKYYTPNLKVKLLARKHWNWQNESNKEINQAFKDWYETNTKVFKNTHYMKG